MTTAKQKSIRVKKNPKRRTRKKSAARFTRKANTPKRKRMWKDVYKSVRKRGYSESRAIKQASGVLKKRVTRLRKNPTPKFVICASGRGSWYFRQSTGSFVKTKHDATNYKSASHAARVAKSIIGKLPRSIASLTVERG